MQETIIIRTLESNYRIYLLPSIGVQAMAPPLAINKEQILDTFYRIWSTMVSSLSTVTEYYLSITLNGSLSHKRSSPIMAAIYLCKCDNLACRIPFYTLPCFVSYHACVTGKVRVLKFQG